MEIVWKWRNNLIHDGEFEIPRNKAQIAYQIVEDCRRRKVGNLLMEVSEESVMVCWEKPPTNWCKLNTDGCCLGNGKGGCGGVIRGDCGEWIRGFSIQLSDTDPIEAELCGLIEGLELCWGMGFSKVIAEGDAKKIIQTTLGNQTLTGFRHLQERLNEIISRGWEIRLQHVYREGNRCADKLANLSLERDCQRKIWESPPLEVLRVLEEDRSGVPVVRGRSM